jgi:hypothetical protein
MVKSSVLVAFAATPRGVACASESRCILVGSGVAAGAKTLFLVLAGRLGEKEVDGGLSVMAEARKIFRAVAMEPCVKLLDGISSRVSNVFLVEDCCGVPKRLAEAGP